MLLRKNFTRLFSSINKSHKINDNFLPNCTSCKYFISDNYKCNKLNADQYALSNRLDEDICGTNGKYYEYNNEIIKIPKYKILLGTGTIYTLILYNIDKSIDITTFISSFYISTCMTFGIYLLGVHILNKKY